MQQQKQPITERITRNVRAVVRMTAEISYAGFTEMAPTLTPLAPAFFFAVAIGTAAYAKTAAWPAWPRVAISLLVGLVAAAGLESAGFMAFSSATQAWRQGIRWALALPALYLLIGIVALWTVEDDVTAVIGTALFLLAACVYASRMVLVEVRTRARAQAEEQKRKDDELIRAAARQADKEEQDREWQQQQQEAQAQREHEARMRQMELNAQAEEERIRRDAAVKVARAQAKIAAEKARQVAASSGDNKPTINTTDWRHVPAELQRRFHKMTSGEIRETFGNLDARKVRDWRRYSEQLVAEIVANGHEETT